LRFVVMLPSGIRSEEDDHWIVHSSGAYRKGSAVKVVPTSETPPHSYAQSQVLRPPRGRVTFDHLVRNVQRFNRDSLLVMGTRFNWLVYLTPGVFDESTTGSQDNFLVHARCDALLALACMFCRRLGRATVTEIEFRLLCWELHNCEDYAIAQSTAGREEIERSIPKYEELLQTIRADSPLRRVPAHGLAYAHLAAAVGRMASDQWHTYTRSRSYWVRACLIYEEFLKVAPSLSTLREHEHRYFRTTYDRFLWAALGLVAITNHDPRGLPCPGILHMTYAGDPGPIDSEHISFGDMAVVASVLAADFSHYRQRAAALNALPEWQRPHSIELRALTAWPLIREDAPQGELRLFLPSPYKMLAAAPDRLLFGFIDFLEDNALVEDAYGLRGQAFAQYLRSVAMNVPGVIDVDAVAGVTGRRPDFVWLGTEFGIVIEIKFGLSPNTERYQLSPRGLLEAWSRACGALEQANDFLRSHRSRLPNTEALPSRWLALVVTYEELPRETTWFHLAAKRWSLLEQTGVEALHLAGIQEFEQALVNGTADEYGRAIAEHWAALNPDTLSQPTMRTPSGPPPAVIRGAWDRLLPDVPTTW
jgi:hypothetical protein